MLKYLIIAITLLGFGLFNAEKFAAALPEASETAAAAEEALDEWPDDDWPEAWEWESDQVNGGELTFLLAPPSRQVHHHVNEVTLSPASLVDGWSAIYQCHYHLDRFERVQITYRPGRIRQLTIERSQNIAESWVEGHTIQLRGVTAGAEICLRGESKLLSDLGGGRYRLNSGPFMRRFLDGYYPMQVSYRLRLAATPLRFAAITPAPQPGFRVWEEENELRFNAWFEGRLSTEIVLERR